MNKLENIFKEKENVNIGYIVGGFPDIDYTRKFLLNLKNHL